MSQLYNLLATSQTMVVYSSASLVDDAGLSLDAIVFKVMQWGSSTTSSQFYSENEQKSHPRWWIYMSRMKQNSTVFNQKFSEEFTRCLIGMGYNLKGFFLAHWFEPRFFFFFVGMEVSGDILVVSGAIGLRKLISR